MPYKGACHKSQSTMPRALLIPRGLSLPHWLPRWPMHTAAVSKRMAGKRWSKPHDCLLTRSVNVMERPCIRHAPLPLPRAHTHIGGRRNTLVCAHIFIVLALFSPQDESHAMGHAEPDQPALPLCR